MKQNLLGYTILKIMFCIELWWYVISNTLAVSHKIVGKHETLNIFLYNWVRLLVKLKREMVLTLQNRFLHFEIPAFSVSSVLRCNKLWIPSSYRHWYTYLILVGKGKNVLEEYAWVIGEGAECLLLWHKRWGLWRDLWFCRHWHNVVLIHFSFDIIQNIM